MGFTLYPYQEQALEALRAGIRSGHQRQILCLPTGAGKTVLAAGMIEAAVAKGKRVAFICDRVALIEQTCLRLSEAGIEHGIVAGDLTRAETHPILVYSAQTLAIRGWGAAAPDLIVIDEAHTQYKATLKIIEDTTAPVIGLTATPFSRGLGKIYSNVVSGITTDELIAQKVLVPIHVIQAKPIDMKGAPTNSMGEWSGKTVESRAIPIVGDIVTEWLHYTNKIFGGPVKTLLFSATVAHGDELCREFQAKGYDFQQVSYRSSGDSKESSIDAFRNGRILGLTSCDALAKGFDVPDALCMISARPYRKSLQSHIQSLGRIMRSSQDKSFGLLMDHAGNYLRHAEATERFWAQGVNSLDESDIRSLTEGAEEKKTGHRVCENPSCRSVMPDVGRVCPYCGWERPKRMADVQAVVGTMEEYRPLDKIMSRQTLWRHVSRYAVDRHSADKEKARKFAAVQYKEITGHWPQREKPLNPARQCDGRVAAAIEVNLAAWIQKQRRIGYGKRKAAGA